MKKFLLSLLFLCFVFEPVLAGKKSKPERQDEEFLTMIMQASFISMPDTLLPYLNRRTRNYLIELSKIGGYSYVDNNFGDKSTLHILSPKHIQVFITDEVLCDMLIYKGGFLWITTMCSPECYSRATLYSAKWEKIEDVLPPNDSVFVRSKIVNDSLLWVHGPIEEDELGH